MSSLYPLGPEPSREGCLVPLGSFSPHFGSEGSDISVDASGYDSEEGAGIRDKDSAKFTRETNVDPNKDRPGGKLPPPPSRSRILVCPF